MRQFQTNNFFKDGLIRVCFIVLSFESIDKDDKLNIKYKLLINELINFDQLVKVHDY